MIDGVRLTPLRQISDARGSLMHMLREDDPYFERFGEIYFSWVNPGAVKAWRLHRIMVRNYAVPVGVVKVVLYDPRPRSPTAFEIMEVILDPEHYSLLTIPPGLWSGFQGIGKAASMIANCTSVPHDPNEVERRDPTTRDIPYVWTPQI